MIPKHLFKLHQDILEKYNVYFYWLDDNNIIYQNNISLEIYTSNYSIKNDIYYFLLIIKNDKKVIYQNIILNIKEFSVIFEKYFKKEIRTIKIKRLL